MKRMPPICLAGRHAVARQPAPHARRQRREASGQEKAAAANGLRGRAAFGAWRGDGDVVLGSPNPQACTPRQ